MSGLRFAVASLALLSAAGCGKVDADAYCEARAGFSCADAAVKVTEMQATIDELQTRIAALEAGGGGQAEVTAEDFAALQAEVDDLADDVASHAGVIAALDAEVEANTADIAANAADIAADAADIAADAADIAANTADIAANTADIAANTADIAANTDDVATNATDIATNAASIAALEAASGTAECDCEEVVGLSSYVTVDTSTNTIVFSGANVYIQDGSADTEGDSSEATWGLGNLVIGYDEDCSATGGVADDKTGSHNLVVGPYHTYSGWGGLVAGYDNAVAAHNATVAGGSGNTASGHHAVVTGGWGNTASGQYAAALAGDSNLASGAYSAVAAGYGGTASGSHASVLGGHECAASGDYATAAGGDANEAAGTYDLAP